MKVTGDSSHNYRHPQVKSQNTSRIIHKTRIIEEHNNSLCQADKM